MLHGIDLCKETDEVKHGGHAILTNRLFKLLFLFLYVVGIALAYFLASLHRVEPFKLLNVVGIVYGLLGVIVLSEFVLEIERWRHFVVEILSGVLLWAQFAVPFGLASASFVLFFIDKNAFPSSLVVGEASLSFFLYSLLPTAILEDVVLVPKLKISKDPLVRARRLGLFLVVAGIVVQLIAAIQDLLKS
jgi:hypothetical protein